MKSAPVSAEQAEVALEEATRWLVEKKKAVNVAVHDFGVAVEQREKALAAYLAVTRAQHETAGEVRS